MLHAQRSSVIRWTVTPPIEDNPANGPFYARYVPKTESEDKDIAELRLPGESDARPASAKCR